MQGTQVRALVREDPTCRRATKPVRHNYSACAPEPVSHNYWSPRATTTEACMPRARAPQEKPPHCNQEQPALTKTRNCTQQPRPNAAPRKKQNKTQYSQFNGDTSLGMATEIHRSTTGMKHLCLTGSETQF